MFGGRLAAGAPVISRAQRRLSAAAQFAPAPLRAAPANGKNRESREGDRVPLARSARWGEVRAKTAQSRSRSRQQFHEGGGASLHYDGVEEASGDSVVQLRFNTLVREALLQYGPPLPPAFVADNDISAPFTERSNGAPTSARQNSHNAEESGAAWRQDAGADGRSFVMYDEVGLHTHELLGILRRRAPAFSFKDDCDGVPFSLLIKNCSYLRAFGGKVNYMRYLRRERHGQRSRIVVSLAKYKMREAAAEDGVRQGPQPWRYSYKMV